MENDVGTSQTKMAQLFIPIQIITALHSSRDFPRFELPNWRDGCKQTKY